jgi:hypothetical protein
MGGASRRCDFPNARFLNGTSPITRTIHEYTACWQRSPIARAAMHEFRVPFPKCSFSEDVRRLRETFSNARHAGSGPLRAAPAARPGSSPLSHGGVCPDAARAAAEWLKRAPAFADSVHAERMHGIGYGGTRSLGPGFSQSDIREIRADFRGCSFSEVELRLRELRFHATPPRVARASTLPLQGVILNGLAIRPKTILQWGAPPAACGRSLPLPPPPAVAAQRLPDVVESTAILPPDATTH